LISSATPHRQNDSALVWWLGVRMDDLHVVFSSEFTNRNFYGPLKVYTDEKSGYKTIQHGQISHGSQFIVLRKRSNPRLIMCVRVVLAKPF
jgi:hypothetical protein